MNRRPLPFAAGALLASLTMTACSTSSPPAAVRQARAPAASKAPTTTAAPSTTTSAVPAAPTSSIASQTQVIPYEPFTSAGTLDPQLHISEVSAADQCFSGGVADGSYRCFGHGGRIFDPCFARPGAGTGPLICTDSPTESDVFELTTGTLPPPDVAAEPRSWAMQLSYGDKICVLVDAAWGDLGPFACQGVPSLTAAPPADCHVPQPATPWWTAACQLAETPSSPFTSYTVVKVWR